MKLILGSSSPARQALLKRLQIPFSVIAPNIDETLLLDEKPQQAVQRLALKKAMVVNEKHPNAVIIACDQLLTVNDTILSKPHTHENAIKQLQSCSEQIIHSYTALVVQTANQQPPESTVVEYQVKFKALSDNQIESYLKKDNPYFCAGSIKAESLGPVLFEWMRGDDPSALIGLPLISLAEMLPRAGIALL